MKIRKAFKFRLKTNPVIEERCRQQAGCCRKVWNLALDLQKKRLENKESCLSYNKLAEQLIQWKKNPEFFYLNAAHSQTLQQSLMFLDQALKAAFDKTNPKRFPKFKKKGMHDSFRYPQGFKLQGKQVFLPKIGWASFYKSRAVEGIPKNVTISRRGKYWMLSIQTEQELVTPQHPSPSMVGIDMGVKQFATLSTGMVVTPVNALRKLAHRLRHAQRDLCRKVKGSKNREKQKEKITKIHHRIADTRQDHLHKASTTICKNHAIIVVEDLKVKNMTRSANGNHEQPGKNVKAKSGLNKSILDQGWGNFRRMLEYKSRWRGGEVLVVTPHYTSQQCNHCGHIAADNRASQAHFCCVACQHTENADLNAARNILRAGHAQLACGEVIRPGVTQATSVKQEPTANAA